MDPHIKDFEVLKEDENEIPYPDATVKTMASALPNSRNIFKSSSLISCLANSDNKTRRVPEVASRMMMGSLMSSPCSMAVRDVQG